ncbi:hypothetical protein [Rhizobium leguminosarum]|uniref:hypothetical protein n=1 Tax=Rhizobium leguminosarum TaxID=384 RepID=UPI0013EE8252|nr:hypothetical protein [Rhizobium leguminosarum]
MELTNIVNSLLTNLARIVRATITVSFMIAALSGAVAEPSDRRDRFGGQNRFCRSPLSSVNRVLFQRGIA